MSECLLSKSQNRKHSFINPHHCRRHASMFMYLVSSPFGSHQWWNCKYSNLGCYHQPRHHQYGLDHTLRRRWRRNGCLPLWRSFLPFDSLIERQHEDPKWSERGKEWVDVLNEMGAYSWLMSQFLWIWKISLKIRMIHRKVATNKLSFSELSLKIKVLDLSC